MANSTNFKIILQACISSKAIIPDTKHEKMLSYLSDGLKWSAQQYNQKNKECILDEHLRVQNHNQKYIPRSWMF
jgi:hypothetical protein